MLVGAQPPHATRWLFAKYTPNDQVSMPMLNLQLTKSTPFCSLIFSKKKKTKQRENPLHLVTQIKDAQLVPVVATTLKGLLNGGLSRALAKSL